LFQYSDPEDTIVDDLLKEEKNGLLISSNAKVTSPNDQLRLMEQAITEFMSNLFIDVYQSKAKLIELLDTNWFLILSSVNECSQWQILQKGAGGM